MAAGKFDKDFGYLMPFLDKLSASIAEVGDASAREELAGLMSGEKDRWARIRELLSAAPDTPLRQAPVKPGDNQPQTPAPTQAPSEPEAVTRPQLRFTVGSLRPGPR